MPSQLPPNHPTQFGFWNTAHDDDDDDGGYAAADSSFTLENEKHMSSTSHTISRFDAPNLYFNQPHAFQITLQNHTLGSGLDNNTPILGDHYENGLFSSSLSDIFTRKLRLSANDNSSIYGHSVGASHYEEEPFESLEEIEAQTIGNLLPDDDDLLSGVTDGLDCKLQPAAGGDVEDLDFFSSVGGMELGEDGGGGQRNYETSATQQPSRTLFVRNIDSNVDDSELRILFEQYGEIHTLYTASKHRGFVMISYYDIRATKRAMQALQNKPLRSRKLDIHYSLPKDNPSDKDINQGTVTIYNLDSSVSNVELRHVFGAYGEVKEIHDGPQGSRHKSIEFYDIRAAETALRELHKSDIGGKQMKLVSSYAGASKRLNTPFPELNLDETSALLQMCSPPTNFTRDISGSVPNVPASVSNNFSSITGVESGGLPSTLRNQRKYDFRSTPNYHPQSLPEYHDGLINSIQCNSPSSMAANLNGRISERVVNRHFNRIGGSIISEPNDKVFGNASYMWNPSHQRPPHNMIWPNSPSLMNGVGNVHSLPRAPSNMANNFLHIDNHHVGSAPSVNPSIWDRRKSFIGESPDASVLHSGSPGNMRFPGNSLHPLDFVSHNMFPPRLGGNSVDLPIPSRNIGLAPHHQNNVVFPNRGQMLNSFDSPSDRARSRRNEGNSNQADSKKQFELDLDRIMRGEDRRTTLMIKNIPNKYTSKMLLAAIDERHRGTYDFIYLPIDFKNKCNVGYAFINMTEPTLIIPFYQAFNGKKWEKFNSEKVASIAYARIQGKAALIAHFQNSSLMNEDKRCRPILFHTDGPNAGDQVPFPMGVNVRSRVNKNRNSTNEEDVEAFSNGGDSSSGSAKDFE